MAAKFAVNPHAAGADRCGMKNYNCSIFAAPQLSATAARGFTANFATISMHLYRFPKIQLIKYNSFV